MKGCQDFNASPGDIGQKKSKRISNLPAGIVRTIIIGIGIKLIFSGRRLQ